MGEQVVTMLVLGAGGFIGSAVVRRAQLAGLPVVATSRKGGAGFVRCDITAEDQMIKCLRENHARVIVNCVGVGATAGSGDEDEIWRINEQGTKNLIEAISTLLKEDQTQLRLIHLGSSRERHVNLSAQDRGATSESYAGSKKASAALIETMVREGGNAVNLRVHNTFGLGQPPGRLVSSVVLSAVAGDSTYIKNPYQVHDFVHVDDVADAVLLAAQSEVTPAESIEIGTGTGTSVLELARMVYALAEAPQELLTFDEKSLAGSPEVADTALACELLGWQARVGLMDGLGEMVSALAQSVTPTSGTVVSQ